VAKIACPQKCDHGYHHSSGDGWDEWDDCRCCNPKGDNDSGLVSERRLSEWLKAEAEEEKHVAAQIRAWEAEMAKPCPKCGVALIDHASRDSCQTIEQFNKEFAEEKARRKG
jgi:hypothetical protein